MGVASLCAWVYRRPMLMMWIGLGILVFDYVFRPEVPYIGFLRWLMMAVGVVFFIVGLINNHRQHVSNPDINVTTNVEVKNENNVVVPPPLPEDSKEPPE